MYLKLFNRVSDALGILQKAQQEGENAYIEDEEAPLVLLERDDDEIGSDHE